MNIQQLDTQLLLHVNHGMANALFDIVMPALSQNGYLLVIPFVLALFPWSLRRESGKRPPQWYVAAVVLIACSAVYAGLHAEHLLKNVVGRVRPCAALEGLRQVIPCPGSFSLPSGHAVSSFAFVTPILYLLHQTIPRSWCAYPLVLASLIACSRIYLGVHYPTDVLAGAAVGAAIGLGLSWLFERSVDRVIWLQKRRGSLP